jgi:hypothetical protein
VNILLFHGLMNPTGIGLGVFVTIFWSVVFVSVRSAFGGIFQARVDMKTAPAHRSVGISSATVKQSSFANQNSRSNRTRFITSARRPCLWLAERVAIVVRNCTIATGLAVSIHAANQQASFKRQAAQGLVIACFTRKNPSLCSPYVFASA